MCFPFVCRHFTAAATPMIFSRCCADDRVTSLFRRSDIHDLLPHIASASHVYRELLSRRRILCLSQSAVAISSYGCNITLLAAIAKKGLSAALIYQHIEADDFDADVHFISRSFTHYWGNYWYAVTSLPLDKMTLAYLILFHTRPLFRRHYAGQR